jgi:transposase
VTSCLHRLKFSCLHSSSSWNSLLWSLRSASLSRTPATPPCHHCGLEQSPVLHADETGLNVNGQSAWVHVLSSRDLVLMGFHMKRGKVAMDEIGILPKYGGILVHDFWQPYYGYNKLEHAACGAHLLRELQYVVEAHGHKWAKLMQEVLLDGLELMHERKRVKTAKTKARNLLERFRDFEDEILRFAREPIVPFTNNIAERDLRMVKVKVNVSGYFRSEDGARAFCRIRSYLMTQWRKGIPPIQALKSAIEGQINYE